MENKTATIEDAIAIAAQAHKGQQDKAGAPNIARHPRPCRAMLGAPQRFVVSIDVPLLEVFPKHIPATNVKAKAAGGCRTPCRGQPKMRFRYSMLFVAMTSAPSSNLKTSTETTPS